MQRTLKSDLALVVDFLRELVQAVISIPGEMRQEWKDAHTRTDWLRLWEDAPLADLAGNAAAQSYRDWKLWHKLGIVSDALLVLIVLLVILAVLL
jgi:hypothetical protein